MGVSACHLVRRDLALALSLLGAGAFVHTAVLPPVAAAPAKSTADTKDTKDTKAPSPVRAKNPKTRSVRVSTSPPRRSGKKRCPFSARRR